MGDVPTGDGIERVSEVADALLAPHGGEGGSVPQALGSKAEERAKRRKRKKDSYAKYLESPEWKKIRRAALNRDKHKCLACGEKAQHVHHIRYPKNLGEEKMEWLYSLCADCHNAIHRAAKTMPLRTATNLILAAPEKNANVTVLPDDWRLSKSATRDRNLRRRKKRPNQLRQHTSAPRKKRKRKKVKPAHIAADKKKRMMLSKSNDELHEFFKANRERRERRWDLGH